jgi:hypothetical protein
MKPKPAPHVLIQIDQGQNFLATEHQYCLQFCKKIRTGLQHSIDPFRIKRYADWFFTSYIATQFTAEEELLYTLLPKGDENIRRALAEHRRIKRLFADTRQVEKSLSLLEEEFELHLRYEELILYPKIKTAVSPTALEEFTARYSPVVFLENTGDMFWRV